MFVDEPVSIRRTDISTGLSYPALVQAFERELDRWDAAKAQNLVQRKAPWAEVLAEANRVGGVRGLMIIESIDQGVVTSLSGHAKLCKLYLVGNPTIASLILDIDPRGALYVPFRVCLYDDGGAAGAGICFDRPSSLLAGLGHAGLSEIGRQLDDKIDSVTRAVTASLPVK